MESAATATWMVCARSCAENTGGDAARGFDRRREIGVVRRTVVAHHRLQA